MKKIVMTAVVVLLAGTPLAFAASSGNNMEPDSRHCTYLGEKYDLCHQDRHKDDHGARGKGCGFGK